MLEIINNYTLGVIEGLVVAYHLCVEIQDIEKIKTILHELLIDTTKTRYKEFMVKQNSKTYREFKELHNTR